MLVLRVARTGTQMPQTSSCVSAFSDTWNCFPLLWNLLYLQCRVANAGSWWFSFLFYYWGRFALPRSERFPLLFIIRKFLDFLVCSESHLRCISSLSSSRFSHSSSLLPEQCKQVNTDVFQCWLVWLLKSQRCRGRYDTLEINQLGLCGGKFLVLFHWISFTSSGANYSS